MDGASRTVVLNQTLLWIQMNDTDRFIELGKCGAIKYTKQQMPYWIEDGVEKIID